MRKATLVHSPSRNPQTEQHLTDRGFTWGFMAVKLGEVDEDRSLHNQARIGKPVESGTVDRYVTAMSQGSVFPAIILAETPGTSRRYQVVDGNHRFQAAKQRDEDYIDAYVITGAAPAAITLLTFEANTRHGLPSSTEDQIHQGLWMMDNGISAEEAARRLGGVKAATLRTAAKEAENDQRAEQYGINRARWDRLPRAIRGRLGQLTSDDAFGPMAQLTIDAGLGAADVTKAVTELNKLRTHASQQEYIKALRLGCAASLQAGGTNLGGTPGPGQRNRSGRTALAMSLGQIANLPPTEVMVERMTDDEKPEWRERVRAAIERLQAVQMALTD